MCGLPKEENVVDQYKQRVSLLQRTVETAYTQLDEMRADIEGKNNDLVRLEDLKDEVDFLCTRARTHTHYTHTHPIYI